MTDSAATDRPCPACGLSERACLVGGGRCCDGCSHLMPTAATPCAVEGCERPGVMRVTGTYPLPGREPLHVEALICREHALDFGGNGDYSIG